ncbi:MAG: glucokinase [Pacificimonas sp.]|jgi:glucokinase|nr:glucokinase [Pacificimonas sp.]
MTASTQIAVADIGGTHARFSLASISGGTARLIGDPVILKTADHEDLSAAWLAFGAHLDGPLPDHAAFAIAAAVGGQTVNMPNGRWSFAPENLGAMLGLRGHLLLNDFQAVAHAVDQAEEGDFLHIAGPDLPLPSSGVVSIVGPGTGLGVAALNRASAGAASVLPTEGGHIGFAPVDALEDRLLEQLRGDHGRVSVERVVSGAGLRAIWHILAKIRGETVPNGDDVALWQAALAGESPAARAALERFCQCLGSVAGDIALVHGAGGVVIAGGLGRRLAAHLPASGFAQRFVDKGRYRALMQGLPVRLITMQEPGLFGAAAAYAAHRSG